MGKSLSYLYDIWHLNDGGYYRQESTSFSTRSIMLAFNKYKLTTGVLYILHYC